jgi:hypothetical protein
MSEVAEKTAEVVADNVEEAMDDLVDVVEVVRNNPVVLVTVGVLGLAAGAAAGYFVAKRSLREFYADLASEEIAEAREFYAGLNKVTVEGEPLSPQDVLGKTSPEAVEAVRRYRGETPAETEEDLEPALDEQDEAAITRLEEKARHDRAEDREEKSKNVFVDPTFDISEEVKHRTKEKAYVITHDEYFAGDLDYDTIQLTYFEGDDTLVGEDDKPVDDLTTINEDNLARFGHGSRDKNIVYVRNEKLETDYEITLSTQSYLEALGLGPEPKELRHANRNAQLNRRREFRRGE